MDNKQSLIYGIVVGLVIFFVGWITGMGGSILPNLIFSALMGLLATILMRFFTKFVNKK